MTGFPKKVKSAARILVIDDEIDIALSIKMGLDREGISSDAFADPLEALKHFRLHAFDYSLVLSDMRMPVMSGFDLVRQIRGIRSEMNVILMTAFEINNSEFEKVFPSTKVNDIIQKPFSINELMSVIQR